MSKTIKFFSNGTEKDREALIVLTKENVPFVNLGPITERETPIIEYGFVSFYGLKEIQRFINEYWKSGRLSSVKT